VEQWPVDMAMHQGHGAALWRLQDSVGVVPTIADVRRRRHAAGRTVNHGMTKRRRR
jgi:hypothetical protein